MKKIHTRENLMLSFNSIPPRSPADIEKLMKERADKNKRIRLSFERPQTLLREIWSVLSATTEVKISNLTASDLAFLKGFESLELGGLRPIDTVEYASFTVRFQAGCFRQMERACTLFASMRGARHMKLSMFELPKDEFMKDVPKMPAWTTPLPQMLEKERPKDKAEIEGAMIGNMIAFAMGIVVPNDKEHGNKMENLIKGMLEPRAKLENSANNSLIRRLDERSIDSMLTRGRAGQRFEHLTRKEYTEMIKVFCATRLELNLLETLSVRATMPGEGIKGEFLFSMPSLRVLSLSFCCIDDAAFASIGPVIGQRLPCLEELDLARNRLSKSDLGAMVGQSLRRVDLSFNPINGVGYKRLFAGLEGNATVESVNMERTSPSELIAALSLRGPQLAEPSSLREINLTQCGIGDGAFGTLAVFLRLRAPGLRKLTLARNELENARLAEIVGPELQSIDLCENPLLSAESLFMRLDANKTLSLVNLSLCTRITGPMGFEHVRNWRAKPAVLKLPSAFGANDTVLRAMIDVIPDGVEMEIDPLHLEELKKLGAPI